MARRLLLLALLGGCRGLLGIEDPIVGDAGGADAAADAAPCEVKQRRFDVCALGMPQPALHLTAGTYTFDTSATPATLTGLATGTVTTSLVQTQSDGQPVVILYVQSLSIDTGATVNIIGARPAIFAAVGDLVVSGVLDASSSLAEIDMTAHVSQTVRFGAGANQACTTATGGSGGDALPTSGSGGGGGGGFAAGGGHGGTGDMGGATSGSSGAARSMPTTVRGGCAGGTSGASGQGAVQPATQATRSASGAGGGAIHLASRTAIKISGNVFASGAGGAGAPQGSACGGGGGGSGGYLGLDAPRVEINGKIGAVGGGGGGGAQSAGHGVNGTNGTGGTAPGGAAQPCGTAGGAGGGGMLTLGGASVDTSDSCGGGGGGGGAGFIMIWAQTSSLMNASITPPPVLDPP